MPYAQADIAGDVVLVTGATSGIGEACAWRFAEAGCKLVLTGRRAQRLDSLKASIEAKHEGVTVTCVTMDVTDLERVAALPGALLPLEVDILVNNAGLALGVAPAEANSMADVQQMMATNVTGLIAMSAAFLPGMKARGKGHLINIGSIAGHEAYAGGSGYCASKAAVTAFTLKHNPDPKSNPIQGASIRCTIVTDIGVSLTNPQPVDKKLMEAVMAESAAAGRALGVDWKPHKGNHDVAEAGGQMAH